MIRVRAISELRASSRGVIPLVVALALVLLLVAGLLLAFVGVPIAIHIGTSP
jgi:hypothetical protein